MSSSSSRSSFPPDAERPDAERPLGGRRLALVATLVLSSCRADPSEIARSSSVVIDETRDLLWVTSPDDDRVVALSRVDGSEVHRIPVRGAPEQLAWVGDRLVVTHGADHEVSVIDPSAEASVAEIDRVALPCGSSAGIVALDVETAAVACPHDERVIELSVSSGEVTAHDVAGRPTGLARREGTLFVAAARGHVVSIDLATWTLSDTSGPPLRVGEAASQLAAITVSDRGGVHASYQRVELDTDRDRDPARGGYGAVIDGAPRIEARVLGPCGDRYVRFDGGPLAMSGPSAIAAEGGLLWIVHQYTDNVLVARCDDAGDAREGTLEVIATFRTGRGPRGIVLAEGGRTAFVDVGFDWAVARLDAPEERTAGVLTPTWTRRRTLGATAMSTLALRGRSAFFDAVDTHLTPSGVVTCGTCHPSGGEDGLTWFLHTSGVPRKLRRTPPAWGARTSLAPYHWDGELRDAAELARMTTHELMEGDGLLVDFDAIAAFMNEVPPPPPRPSESEPAARGRATFLASGCADCHVASESDGLLHDVVPASSDPDARLRDVNTPSLTAVRTRAPYFHDGRAATLRDTVTVPDDVHGRTSALSPDQIDDLVAFLESL